MLADKSLKGIRDSSSSDKKKEGFLGQMMLVVPPNILRSIRENVLVKNIYLTDIGYYPHAKFHDRIRKNGSDEYILLYCVAGQGIVEIDASEHRIHSNHYIIIPPHIPHHYRSVNQNPWSIYWIHFKGPGAKQLFYRNYLDAAPSAKPIVFREDRIKQFLDIYSILDLNFEERSLELANIKLINLLGSFIYQPELNPQVQRKNAVTQTIEFMKSNLDKNFKIQNFADNLNLSVSRFSEIFKENTGSSPMQYFTTLKIQKSCQYLYYTDKNIKEICALIGFEDPFYFSRIFKKMMGVSPSKYKKDYQK